MITPNDLKKLLAYSILFASVAKTESQPTNTTIFFYNPPKDTLYKAVTDFCSSSVDSAISLCKGISTSSAGSIFELIDQFNYSSVAGQGSFECKVDFYRQRNNPSDPSFEACMESNFSPSSLNYPINKAILIAAGVVFFGLAVFCCIGCIACFKNPCKPKNNIEEKPDENSKLLTIKPSVN